MLIRTSDLLSDHGYLNKDQIESLVRSLTLGDEVPSIIIHRVEDFSEFLMYTDRKRLEILLGNCVVFNGNHRAKAHDLLGLPIEAELALPESELYDRISEVYARIGIETLLSFSELELRSDPEEFAEIKASVFYK